MEEKHIRKRKVAFIIHEGYEDLDLCSAMTCFRHAQYVKHSTGEDMQLYEATIITMHDEKEMRSWGGLVAKADYSYPKDKLPVEKFDITVVPGGMGNRKLIKEGSEGKFMKRLRTFLKENTKIIFTICTGSATVAQTGLLDGMRVSTNFIAYPEVIEQTNKPKWEFQRVINNVDPKTETGIITTSGVSAGIDGSLAVIQMLNSNYVAVRLARRIEYNWPGIYYNANRDFMDDK
mmetsp:Transcript_11497/g.17027  ORF Transcript_11497/g.17027 Transcript_11497/m.17027 type:complete len:233 (+) Transcript_11497:119-817(+)